MSKLSLTINNNLIKADRGKTILEVIKEFNLAKIPTLCFDKDLTPFGSCFLCVVKVEGINRLVPSCATPISEGMVIYTDTKEIRESRKTALELLLSNHYADCDAPCSISCPANVDIQSYIALADNGKYKEAIELIRKKNPLPIICGRICVRKCELNCRRPAVDDTAVGINFIKRYASEIERKKHSTEKIKNKNNKKIAVIGGGPSGLTISYYLILKGYQVTIFEMMPKLGGMLRYGIPEYRLPKKLLDEEIKFITQLGINVKTEVKLGNDFSISSLKQDGYEAIYLSLGAWKHQSMRLEGENTINGVIPGIKYLREFQLGIGKKLNGKVIVVGGGNTAIDATRTSLREKNVSEVVIVYRRTKKEMPADPLEIHAAEEEGIKFEFLVSPVEIIHTDNILTGLKCIKMSLGEPDASGRRRPIPIENSEFIIPCNYIISAIGQKTDLNGIEIDTTRWGTISIDENNYTTSIDNVFAGGDVVTGPSVVIDAIADGQKAAEKIHQYLNSKSFDKEQKIFTSTRSSFKKPSKDYYKNAFIAKRSEMIEEPVNERIKDLREVELGISGNDISKETKRCLECGCAISDSCILRDYATEYNIDISEYIGDIKIKNIDNSHPFIQLDQNKCILCGRCVRVCRDIVGVGVYGFVDRGFYTEIAPTLNSELFQTECISCGNCIDTCPTGAIVQKSPDKKIFPISGEKTIIHCNYCSLSCEFYLNTSPIGEYYISSSREGDIEGVNSGLHCFKGRFGIGYIQSKERITKPMLKKNNSFVECSFDEAIKFTSNKFKEQIKANKNHSIGLFLSPNQSLEEMYKIKELSKHIKTNNTGSLTYILSEIEGNELNNFWGFTGSTTDFKNLENSDIIVAFGSIEKSNPVAAMKIHKAISNGKKLYLLNPIKKSTLSKRASLILNGKAGTYRDIFCLLNKELLKNIDMTKLVIETNNFSSFFKSIKNYTFKNVEESTTIPRRFLKEFIKTLIKENLNITFVFNPENEETLFKETLILIASYLINSNKYFLPHSGLILPRTFSNSQTSLLIFKDSLDIKKNLLNNKIHSAFIIGEDPMIIPEFKDYFNNFGFLAVADYFMTETAEQADIVFPLSSYLESDITFINSENKIITQDKILPSTTEININNIIEKISINLDFEIENKRELILDDFKSNYNISLPIKSKFMHLENKFLTEDRNIFFKAINTESVKFNKIIKNISSIENWISNYKNNILD